MDSVTSFIKEVVDFVKEKYKEELAERSLNYDLLLIVVDEEKIYYTFSPTEEPIYIEAIEKEKIKSINSIVFRYDGIADKSFLYYLIVTFLEKTQDRITFEYKDKKIILAFIKKTIINIGYSTIVNIIPKCVVAKALLDAETDKTAKEFLNLLEELIGLFSSTGETNLASILSLDFDPATRLNYIRVTVRNYVLDRNYSSLIEKIRKIFFI